MTGSRGSATDGQMTFEDLYQSTHDQILRFVRARMQDEADAEDVTSQTFLQALPAYDADRSPAEVLGWLFQIARNVMGDHWRHHYRSVPTLPLTEPMVESKPDAQVRHENPVAERRVQETLARLPYRYGRVLELRFLNGASLHEIAGDLETSVANAKVLQHRALRKAAAFEDLIPYQPCVDCAA